jgi:hypothetical protein
MKTTSATFSVRETEDSISRSAAAWSQRFRNRLDYERLKVLTEAVNAWRANPLARRVVEITSEFVLGDGFGVTSRNRRTAAFLRRFWTHELNDMDAQLREWADEAWRSGDLFVLFSTDAGGFPLVRAVPAESIIEIATAPNDYRQETAYKRSGLDEEPYPAYAPGLDSFVLHFPLNRAAGASFGESDLAPLLYWIGLYKQWLEDRARLNYFRQLFSFVVSKPFENEAAQKAYAAELSNRKPQPGAILLSDPGETWSVLAPRLESSEAAEDGLALKRMIATGAGLPLHFLGEPESSTRTTAESAGEPAFKRFKARQAYLRGAVRGVLRAALAVYRQNGGRVPAEAEFEVSVPDISGRDNAELAIAVQRVVNAFAPLYNAKLVDAGEFLRLVYRFLGEVPPGAQPGSSLPVKPGVRALELREE